MGAAGGWLNKQALANVPPNVLNTRIWLIAIWASYCGGLHGFNTANINGIMTMKSFRRDFGLDEMSATSVTNITGWVTSAMLLVRDTLNPFVALIADSVSCRANSAASSSQAL